MVSRESLRAKEEDALHGHVGVFKGAFLISERRIIVFQHTIRVLIFLLGFLPAVALAEDGLSIRGMSKRAERHYLNGLADGFQILNAELNRQGKSPLYCMPQKVVLFGRDLLEFASEDLVGPQEDVDVAVSALFGLMTKYPCHASPKNTEEKS